MWALRPPPAASRASLTSLLTPSLDTLRALQICPVSSDASSSSTRAAATGVWLQWTLPADADASLARVVDAVELLVLLAWADRAAWLTVVDRLLARGATPFAREWATLVVRASHAPRVLGYDVVCLRPHDARLLCAFLATRTTAAQSDKRSARRILEGRVLARIGGAASVQTEIPVRLRLQLSLVRFTYNGRLSTIVTLAKLQHKLDQPTDRARRPAGLWSRVRHVYNDNWLLTDVDAALVLGLAAIWACGVRVEDLPRVQMKSREAPSSAYVAAHRALLGVGREGSVRRVVVPRSYENSETAALLSALAHSTSVREVVFEFDYAPSALSFREKRAIQWMAYAFFSGHATNAITKVSLSIDFLATHHVDLMREILDADEPLEVLYPDCVEAIRAFCGIHISAPRVLLEHPASYIIEDEDLRVLMTDKVFDGLRVLGRTEDWWRVFLPGWGHAWVERDQAVVSPADSNSTIAKIRTVDELKLSRALKESDEPAQALMRLIHGGGRALHLVQLGGSVDDMCPRVFDVCPRVESLAVAELMPDRLAVFVDSFATGRCQHLKRLDIRVERATPSCIVEIQQALETLADPTHPMARQLEAFEVSIVEAGNIVDSNVLDVALDVLQVNVRLNHLKLHLPLVTRDRYVVERLVREFAKYHDVPWPTPVSVRVKAAFLSCVWPATRKHQIASQRFDQRIVSTIFEFVPDLRRRSVDIRMPRVIVGETN